MGLATIDGLEGCGEEEAQLQQALFAEQKLAGNDAADGALVKAQSLGHAALSERAEPADARREEVFLVPGNVGRHPEEGAGALLGLRTSQFALARHSEMKARVASFPSNPAA